MPYQSGVAYSSHLEVGTPPKGALMYLTRETGHISSKVFVVMTVHIPVSTLKKNFRSPVSGKLISKRSKSNILG